MSVEQDFIDFIDSLGLRYFRGREFIPYFHRPKNFMPPLALWPNIVKTIRVLDEIRHKIKAPITMTSTYRSPAYNLSVGGEPNSFHMRFMAIDFQTKGKSPRQVIAVARELRNTLIDLPGNGQDFIFKGGLGLYSTFVHVDTRGWNSDWSG